MEARLIQMLQAGPVIGELWPHVEELFQRYIIYRHKASYIIYIDTKKAIQFIDTNQARCFGIPTLHNL